MRRFTPTIIAGVVMVAFITRGFWGVQTLMKDPELVFDAPGEYRLTVPVASPYTLWYRATASIGGVYQVGDPILPVGTRIEITHGDAVIPTIPDASTRSDLHDGAKVSVLRFEASEPGEYRIKVSGFPGVRHFEVSKGNGFAAFLAVFGAFGAAMACGALVALLLILALLGVWPKKKLPAPPVLTS